MIKGPAQNPRLELSLMVTVKTGPGIIAPESAMTKDVPKILNNTIRECVAGIFLSSTYSLLRHRILYIGPCLHCTTIYA
jgi:hypothetical protein